MIIHSPIISGSLTFSEGSTFTLPDGGIYSGSFSGSLQVDEIKSHLIPDANETYDLGSSTNRFRDVYLSNNSLNFPGGTIGINSDGAFTLGDNSGNPAPVVASEIKLVDPSNGNIIIVQIQNGQLVTTATDSGGTPIDSPASDLSGSFSGSFYGEIVSTNGVVSGSSQVTSLLPSGVVSGSSQITFLLPSSVVSGSSQVEFNEVNNTPFSQSASSVTTSKSIVPTSSTIDLGSVSSPFRDLYLSSASLYIDGQQVISTQNGDLEITTDANQSLRIVEEGVDTITLQTENGDITLVATGTGNIELNAPIQIQAGKQILSSDGNPIVFGEDIDVTGSINLTGNVDGVDVSGLKSDFDTLKGKTLVSGSSQVDVTATTGYSAISSHIGNTSNPHSVTAAQVGLGNVTNESKATMFTSPAFTGTPTAPTPADNDNSTNIATTAFVMREVSDLIGGAGAAFDTLLEISASLAAGDSNLVDLVDGKLSKSQNLNDLPDKSAARTYLGVAIGTDVQAYNSTLASVAGGTYSGDDSITTIGTVTAGSVTAILPSSVVSGSVQVNHDSTTGFVADEHIDHTTVSIIAGNGLTGGGTIASTRTINVVGGNGITVNSDNIELSGGYTGTWAVTGGITATADVVAYASSDERLKDNIEIISNPIEKVQSLKGVTWEWNDNADELQKSTPNVGVIAQDVEKVLPQLVNTRDNGFKAVDYAKLTGLLIEAIKEQQKQIDDLKSRL